MRSCSTTSRPIVPSTSRPSSPTSTPTLPRRASRELPTGRSADPGLAETRSSERRAAQPPVQRVQVRVLGPVDDDPAPAALAALQAHGDTEHLLETPPQ